MTKDETVIILRIISGIYPEYFADMNAQLKEGAVLVWSEVFKNIPYELVRKAVLKYIETNTTAYPPKPGMINEVIRSMISVYNAEEQWCIIEYCVRSIPEGYSRYMREHLDPIAKELIWSGDVQRFKEVAGAMDKHRPRFMKEYEAEKKKAEEKAMETGDLMSITSPERIAELGLQPNDLQIEMKAPNV